MVRVCLDVVSLFSELLFGYPVTVVSGKGYVEVKLLGVNKGKAVEKILKTLTTLHGDVDFVLCIGDDRSDEDMFAVTNSWTSGEGLCLSKSTGPNASSLITHTGRENRPSSQPLQRGSISSDDTPLTTPSEVGGGGRQGPPPQATTARDSHREPHVFTCTVGKKPSHAKFYLMDTGEVSELLGALRLVTETYDSFHHSQSMGPGAFAATALQQPQHDQQQQQQQQHQGESAGQQQRSSHHHHHHHGNNPKQTPTGTTASGGEEYRPYLSSELLRRRIITLNMGADGDTSSTPEESAQTSKAGMLPHA